MSHPWRALLLLLAFMAVAHAAAAQPRPKPRLWLGGSYVASTWSKEAPWQHGFAFSARLAPRDTWHLGLGYEFAAPAQVDTPTLSLQVARHPFELNAGHALWLGPVMMGAELAIILDQVDRTTLPRAATTRATLPESHIELGLSPRVRAAWRPWGPLLLFLSAGAETFLNRVQYMEDSTPRRTVTSPGWLRARLEAGAAIDGW